MNQKADDLNDDANTITVLFKGHSNNAHALKLSALQSSCQNIFKQ